MAPLVNAWLNFAAFAVDHNQVRAIPFRPVDKWLPKG
jgi:hypothetical protein